MKQQFLKSITALAAAAFAIPVNAQSAQMVTEGRNWEYIAETHLFETRFLEKFVLRIEGEATVDGQQYAVVNAYKADLPVREQDKPYCYLRETDDGKVYARTNPEYEYPESHADPFEGGEFLSDGSEFLLVDFNNFYASQTFYPYYAYDGIEYPLRISDYINETNTLKVWELEGTESHPLRMVEKVGYVHSYMPCGLLAPMYAMNTGDDHVGWLYLQLVRDADGRVIYEAENRYTSVVSVASDDTPTAYYDLQGRRIDTGALRQGIYIRQQGDIVDKVLIR